LKAIIEEARRLTEKAEAAKLLSSQQVKGEYCFIMYTIFPTVALTLVILLFIG